MVRARVLITRLPKLTQYPPPLPLTNKQSARAGDARELVHGSGVQLEWGRAHLTSLRARRRSPE